MVEFRDAMYIINALVSLNKTYGPFYFFIFSLDISLYLVLFSKVVTCVFNKHSRWSALIYNCLGMLT